MERYLRPLAIAVVVIEVCAAFLTIPTLLPYLGIVYIFRVLAVNSLLPQTLALTGASLTAVMGILAAIIAAQRGHRPWSIAFAILLTLFAYSPLLLAWVLQSQTFIYDPARFEVNTAAFTFVAMCNHILPAIILAVVVLVYSLRYRRESSQGQDAALEIERSQIE